MEDILLIRCRKLRKIQKQLNKEDLNLNGLSEN